MSSGNVKLENLARAKQLNAEAPNAQQIDGLLAGAEASLRDSGNASLAASSRFMLAYNAAHALALAALRAAGYRPSSAGHRKIVFQVLEATAGAPPELWRALDRYHDRRNAAEYEGAPPATAVEAEDIIRLAAELQKLVLRRVRKER